MNFQDDSIFWIEIDKIKPNPFQPRREFNQDRLQDLSDSIRQYGILQPLVVSRLEVEKEDGGLTSKYELIAGERRLRASKIAGLEQVPTIIRSGPDDDQAKLELAIIENLQREDLNPVDRARAFDQLCNKFKFTHAQVAKKMGKSREYVSNTLRLLSLPDYVLKALEAGRLSEGHSRPIMMLKERPEEQETLFKEVIYKKLTVRETESIARRIAYDKARKVERTFDPEVVEMEEKLAESLGTRVYIEKRNVGGKITIDYFTKEDIHKILDILTNVPIATDSNTMLKNFIESENANSEAKVEKVVQAFKSTSPENHPVNNPEISESQPVEIQPVVVVEEVPESQPTVIIEEVTETVEYPPSLITEETIEIKIEPEIKPEPKVEVKPEPEEDPDLYSLNNFSI